MLAKLQHPILKINSKRMLNLLKINSLIIYTFDSKSERNYAKRCGNGGMRVFRFALGCKKGSKNFGKFWSIFSHG